MIPFGRNYFCHGECIFCMIEIVWIDFSRGFER
ncbi:hypothetical protein L905_09625 [Agrobacterium sp. TS43]|nr:hypothetical protein L902_21915 [Agrobacterium radiobacter DSM 30147]KVK40639.1 hypothetical protein L903_13735 [Agrobacterium sp. JL28]KVK40987.1 hypothetical protein L904_13485 [Agrobacterium sp. LY4]KVK55247.1 hypothetical protein L906_13685 [Agrobacterium sp. TS45]KVK57794.1 hypothetical protein L907_13650 [Agrobacterium sp. C13]KVK70890.1 hypothetical protein L905_09625 [Agrobacterium sp. TS43]